MNGFDFQTVTMALFGVGGIGGLITVVVGSYRKIRLGKITDDGTLLERAYADGLRNEARADAAELDRDHEVRKRRFWQEWAYRYRLQLVQNGIEPVDPVDSEIPA